MIPLGLVYVCSQAKVRELAVIEQGSWVLAAPFQLAVTWTGSRASRGDSSPSMMTRVLGSALAERADWAAVVPLR